VKNTVNELRSIQISIASPDTIRQWSKGAVKKPETINYRTHRPERDGLFCEKIFGPTRDWECFCGKYKSIRYKGLVCERCGVEVTRANVRRERMGHIELVAPVAHIWYSKGTPNYIALLLDISTRDFEKVLYFNSYIVIDPGKQDLIKKQILTEQEFRANEERYGDMFRAGTGGEAIRELLRELDLQKLVEDLKRKVREDSGTKKLNTITRLQVAETFLNSKNRPEWMILEVLPVIPPDLRPMVQLDGGRFATSDLNDLYRRVINRNNRLKRLQKLNAPEIIIKQEKRMLQEAVNQLIDNGRRGRLITGTGNRPLKSLNDMLKGKQGRFRQNLLGKRVDYSGRSVIVVGPKLRLHECGLPQKMAIELFKPFIMNKLVEYGFSHNIKSARKMIEREDANVWKVLEEIVKDFPVLLNRAPTLHRLGIQAFEPVLVKGNAIQLHPLVCEAFNADFDGDQMAVHIPLLLEAQVEARVLMLSAYNILSASSGKAVASPSQDMTIGAFYLTHEIEHPHRRKVLVSAPRKAGISIGLEDMVKVGPRFLISAETVSDSKDSVIIRKGHRITEAEVKDLKKAKVSEVEVYDITVYANPSDAILAFHNGFHGIHDSVIVRNPIAQDSSVRDYIKTTVGRLIFNQIVPAELGYQNTHFDKKKLSALIEQCYQKCGTVVTGKLLDEVKDLAFWYAMKSGLTICLKHLEEPPRKRSILSAADDRAKIISKRFEMKEINLEERKKAEIDLWINATEEVTDDLLQTFKSNWEKGDFNPIYTMATSGARGNVQQMKQLAGMRGLMSNPHGDIMHVPIKASFRDGLNMTDYFISTYGARKGLVDTALRTADSGYLTRRLVDVAQDVIVSTNDCGTTDGLVVIPLRGKRSANNLLVDEIMIPVEERIVGRTLIRDVVNPSTGKPEILSGTVITKDVARAISRLATLVNVKDLTSEMLTDECVVADDGKTVVCGPDQEVTPYLMSHLKAKGVEELRVYPRVVVRSPLTCKVEWGVCRKCYSVDLSLNQEVALGTAVGVIAAQSIGEPGTQLTMRTFHTGGIAEAARITVKAKTSGTVSFADLVYENKVERKHFQIDTGNDASEHDEFEQNIKKIVTGGILVVIDENGKPTEYGIQRGSVLRVSDGDFVSTGQVLVEYNPSNYISSYSGVVKYRDVRVDSGVVVSSEALIDILDQASNEVLDSYKIPMGSVLSVRDGEMVAAGDNLYVLGTERSIAIASQPGRAEFRDIKIKNHRVISENGMIFIASSEHSDQEFEAPKGVKSSATKTIGAATDTGVVLKVKTGDQVKAGDELVTLIAEFDGEVVASGKKALSLVQSKTHEYYMSGTMQVEKNEDEQKLRFIAEASGQVRIVTFRSASNKTVDRKRVLIKEEHEYTIPDGAILRRDNLVVNSGEEVKRGQKISGPIPFVSEIAGTVTFKDHYVRKTLTLDVDTRPEELVGAALLEHVIVDGKVLYPSGTDVTQLIAEDLYSLREQIVKIQISVKSNAKKVVVIGDESSREYVIPEGLDLLVTEGQEIEADAKLIHSFSPIVSEIDGKVNFITEYNKRIGEEVVRTILVYSGRDYFLSNALPLCVKQGDRIEAGEPITDWLEYSSLEQTDNGVRFIRNESNEKKYTITEDMEILRKTTDGAPVMVKAGDKIARLLTPKEGTVKLVHALTKSGKVRSVVDRILVQVGEAHTIPDGAEVFVKEGQPVVPGDILAKWSSEGKKTTDIVQGLPRVSSLFETRKPKVEALIASVSGVLRHSGNNVVIENESGSQKQLVTGALREMVVADGEYVTSGDRLTEGDTEVKALSDAMGIFYAQKYLLNEVQYVYKSQGVTINDKHIETILRRMVSKVRVTHSGDSPYNSGEIVNHFEFKKTNEGLVAQGFKPASAVSVIQGISKASLTTDSFLSAASFQETTKVLTQAAICSKIDNLTGLKENIIMGNLIPAGTGFDRSLKYNFNDKEARLADVAQELPLDGAFEMVMERSVSPEEVLAGMQFEMEMEESDYQDDE